jgi:hypothetical protein
LGVATNFSVCETRALGGIRTASNICFVLGARGGGQRECKHNAELSKWKNHFSSRDNKLKALSLCARRVTFLLDFGASQWLFVDHVMSSAV